MNSTYLGHIAFIQIINRTYLGHPIAYGWVDHSRSIYKLKRARYYSRTDKLVFESESDNEPSIVIDNASKQKYVPSYDNKSYTIYSDSLPYDPPVLTIMDNGSLDEVRHAMDFVKNLVKSFNRY